MQIFVNGRALQAAAAQLKKYFITDFPHFWQHLHAHKRVHVYEFVLDYFRGRNGGYGGDS